MFLWVLKWTVVSIILISLSHYIYVYLKDTLTIPKTRDLIKNPHKRYTEMFSKNYDVEQVNAPLDVTEQNMNGTDITKLDSIISAKDGEKTVETELQMKKELESFIQGLQ